MNDNQSTDSTPRRGKDGRVRYAVIGLGWIAQSAMLPGFANARGNSALAALVSDDPEKRGPLAVRYGVAHTYNYDQYDECLRSGEVDAVYLALPNHLHREYAERAARAGVHVLCEKPLADKEEDGHAMVQACAAAGVKLMVAYRLHLHESLLTAIDVARSGRLGEPRVFTSLFVSPIPAGDVRLRKGAGPLEYIGVYCLNAARHLFADEPEDACALAGSDGSDRFREVEETASVILRFPRGRVATFTCGFNAPYRSDFRLTGTAGDLFVNRAYAMIGEMTGVLTAQGTSEELRFAADDQFGAELTYFSRCVLEGREPQPSGAEGLADLRVQTAVRRSLRSGKVERVDALPPPRRPEPAQRIKLPPTPEPALIKVKAPFDQFK